MWLSCSSSFIKINKSFFESFRSFNERNERNDSEKDEFILMNEFEQESRARWAFVLIKRKLLYLFLKWPLVWLDKTLIHRLVSFKALWSGTETGIWTLIRLVPNEVHYMEKILECFHQKPSFLFDWRKKDVNILDDMGVSKLSASFFLSELLL